MVAAIDNDSVPISTKRRFQRNAKQLRQPRDMDDANRFQSFMLGVIGLGLSSHLIMRPVLEFPHRSAHQRDA